MKKQINEASVRIDVEGLESSDLDTLSRMLALAGQAEQQSSMMSTIPRIQPLDYDMEDGTETQSIMPVAGMEPALDNAVADLAGSVTDFGADAEEESLEMGLDMDGSPSVESIPSAEDDLASEVGEDDISLEVDSDYDDSFDMDRMTSLAGIQESIEEVLDDEADEDEEEDEELGLDESMLPDLSLDEDSVASSAAPENGPFMNERDAVIAAKAETNGEEGNHFIVIPKGNRYFWKRNMAEDVLRNEPECANTAGIENSRHGIRNKRTALGDNPLLSPVHESEDESLDEIKESIEAKFKKFMGDNNVQF